MNQSGESQVANSLEVPGVKGRKQCEPQGSKQPPCYVYNKPEVDCCCYPTVILAHSIVRSWAPLVIPQLSVFMR